ncbi:hypothetical protein M408DRAFT_328650 [Serendipita vermifera MAFF 305830]|uniref:Uncharacterized protein n=1 Tax=Serendipita vermifera MAFF 305830 TaxID=933852 RepID=A0A0C2WUL8_SERVB|nr:hypothetical protein M408DRAFT_328650 [Serendipita vermifera MAFF 305830]
MTSLDNMPPKQLSVNESGGVKLLKLKYLDRTVLTRNTEKFDDIERAARKMFKIKEDISITIAADIPSFDNERMEIDPDIWSAISGEVSIAWVTRQPDDDAGSIPSSITQAVFKELSELDPGTQTVEYCISEQTAPSTTTTWPSRSVILRKNATIQDLKAAICKLDSHLWVEGLHVAEKLAKTSNYWHRDSCQVRPQKYSFYYDRGCVFAS